MSHKVYAVLVIAGVIAVAPGCATKKFVRQTVDPVNQQVGELDKRTADNARAIEQLDEKTQRDISRTAEKASQDTAQARARADEAFGRAGDALTKSGQAAQAAEGARTLAEQGVTKATQVERVVENLDNYQVANTKTVYFDFNKATLQDEAKQQLAELASSLSNMKRFAIEVQGFTDTTGPADYNYDLSQKRADTVVRYLTMEHKVPAYRIHTLALGKDMPAEAENRREARRLSRRVEVKVYAVADSGTQTAGARPQ
jgi:outer membrane protein OmpA-like peptidoglycan-associated protein